MVPKFFENLRDYQEIKHRILRNFLPPWSAKLGSMARSGSGVIWYVDGFAGEGKYKDGSDGSPLLGLRMAEQIQEANRGYKLACYFVEKSPTRWRSLEELAQPFGSDGILVVNQRGEFSSLLTDIEEETRRSPMLLFVDPFGISPLKYGPFRVLLGRRQPLDLILTFQHKAVYRLAKDHPHLVSEAIGSTEWLTNWHLLPTPQSQTERVLRVFREKLLGDGRFLDVFFYPIRSSIKTSPKYYLLFASRSYHAFELWNDQIAQEETTLSQKQYGDLASQQSFLPRFDEEIKALNLLRELRELVQGQEPVTRQSIVMQLIQGRWGHYHTKEIKTAVRSLIESGEIRRDQGSGNDINTDSLHLT